LSNLALVTPDIPKGSSLKNGESSPLEKNLSALMGVSERGKIYILEVKIPYFEKPCLTGVLEKDKDNIMNYYRNFGSVRLFCQ